MILTDGLICIIPILLVIHRRFLDEFTKRTKLMFVISVLLPALHLTFVGFRWQLTLLYVLHGIFAMLAGILIWKGSVYRIGFKGVKKICVIVLSITIGLTALLPVGILPAPTGPYKVGTASITITSPDRRELYDVKYDVIRRFVVQFYYPADRIGTRRAPAIENGDDVERGLSKLTKLPRVFLSHLSQVQSNSWYDTSVSSNEKQYPIIILSHGWKGFKNIQTNKAEELASQGYIVASIDHTYGSISTIFEDGTVKELNQSALPDRADSEHFIKYGRALVETFKGDIIETLDTLEEMNSNKGQSMLSGRLNMDKVAVVGHSMGGGAAVLAAIDDARIGAVVGLDAWVEPLQSEFILSGLDVPYLHVGSESWIGGLNEPNLHMLLASSRNDRWLITIDRTLHTDFTMLSYLSPASGLIGLTGWGGKEAVDIQRDLINTFMDYCINGKNTKNAIVDVVNKYEGATAEAIYRK